MPELADFQLAFAAAIGRTGGGALERQPGFAVYRNTTPNALIEALAAGYPVAACLVGDEAFAMHALDFARRRPPAHPVLLGYGAGFPHFLAGQPWIAEELPYLPDVAEIERLRTEAHVAADSPALTLADLAAFDQWSSLRLPLHPATRFAWLRTPALILQGTRDSFGTPDEVAGYALSPAIRVEWIEDGDHSLVPRKSSGRTRAQNLQAAIDAIAAFATAL